MNVPEPLKGLLVECVECTVNCDRVHLEPEIGIIPRGFCFGSGTIQDKDLMVIFPEPARNDHYEQDRYCRAKQRGGWESVADEANRVAIDYFKHGQSNFHKRTMNLLEKVFGSQGEVSRRCYFTELTKCQKIRKGQKNLIITAPTRRECLSPHFSSGKQ